ncbi:MAG: copper amine oxidase N-terminal domain-containing protein [Defluviitaleaceae bacterium]|nr:copper amine oxidase N-terminal domain-containing protein [Defluviitaleaceae bacterium]
MKNLKKIAAFMLAATLFFAATHAAFAIAIIDEEGNIVMENEELEGGIMTLDLDLGDFDLGDTILDRDDSDLPPLPLARFDSVTGEFVEFRESLDGTKIMRLNVLREMAGQEMAGREDGMLPFELTYDFIIDMNTFIMGVTDEPEVGDTITAFFDASGFMILIYPPQHLALAVVNRGYAQGGLPRVILDRFDDDWTSENYRLNIGEDTEIVFQDGTPFEGEIEELIGRKLVVEFHISHRDIPETIPNPERVTILFERAVHPTIEIDWDDWDLDDWELDQGIIFGNIEIIASDDPWYHILSNWNGYGFDIDWSGFGIIITLNGRALGVPDAKARVVDSDLANYLPLRAVTEMLGIRPEWNDAPYRQIVVQSPRGEISMNVGSSEYSLRSHEGLDVIYTTYTLSPPHIFEGRTYVPLAFFREIFGFSNVYFEGGHVKLDNAERME